MISALLWARAQDACATWAARARSGRERRAARASRGTVDGTKYVASRRRLMREVIHDWARAASKCLQNRDLVARALEDRSQRNENQQERIFQGWLLVTRRR